VTEEIRSVASDDPAMLALLASAGLLTADLAEGLAEYVALGAPPVAFGGIVYCGHHALLRSVVVAESARMSGMGRAIVGHLLSQALLNGRRDVWLLTETAEPFFAALGFERRTRDEAPPAIQTTSQFSKLCPSSSTLMHRSLS
jgi:N-acetylglutamate synthase-like GNAT family acetyltransferase